MLRQSTLRLAAAGLAAVVLLWALPLSVAAAERSIRVYPGEVAVGGTLTVKGSGFGAGYPEAALRAGFPFVTVYVAEEVAEVGDLIDVKVKTYAVADKSSKVDEFGMFTAGFLVPSELADGPYVGDVEEGTYFVYVTYWNDAVIVAASAIEVAEVVEPFPFGFGSPYSPWRWPPYHDCRPYYHDDCPPWDGLPHPFPWEPPDDRCDDWCCNPRWFWDGQHLYLWPPQPYCWRIVPPPPCGC